MNVGELIERLRKLNPELPVVYTDWQEGPILVNEVGEGQVPTWDGMIKLVAHLDGDSF